MKRGNAAACWLALGWALLGGPGAAAHHSLSGQFDIDRTFDITGVVSRVDWVNPHVYLYVDVARPGGKVTYKLESHPVAVMRKSGMSQQILRADGKPVQITAHPARNGTATLGYLVVMKFADGREIQFVRLPGAEDPAAGAR